MLSENMVYAVRLYHGEVSLQNADAVEPYNGHVVGGVQTGGWVPQELPDGWDFIGFRVDGGYEGMSLLVRERLDDGDVMVFDLFTHPDEDDPVGTAIFEVLTRATLLKLGADNVDDLQDILDDNPTDEDVRMLFAMTRLNDV